ncbi:MAG: hypothetical protein L6R28_08000 [Planctomycetes bacterium]|nr:hypothetical protein [Planctomycetota bacterium]
MASHFSSIGFPVQSQDDMLALANQAGPSARPLEVDDGFYFLWASDSGAQLWIQVDKNDDLMGMVPHFSGPSRFRVRLDARIGRPNDSPLDGAIHCWAAGPDGNPQSIEFPFVFDLPDARLHSGLALPSLAHVQLAAFAHEVQIHESVEAYNTANTEEPRMGSQSFIPAGLFSPNNQKPTNPPLATAILNGHVLGAELKTNELSGRTFWWAQLDVLGGTFDAVIDPELVTQEPKVGGVIGGFFWLSGQILEQ